MQSGVAQSYEFCCGFHEAKIELGFRSSWVKSGQVFAEVKKPSRKRKVRSMCMCFDLYLVSLVPGPGTYDVCYFKVWSTVVSDLCVGFVYFVCYSSACTCILRIAWWVECYKCIKFCRPVTLAVCHWHWQCSDSSVQHILFLQTSVGCQDWHTVLTHSEVIVQFGAHRHEAIKSSVQLLPHYVNTGIIHGFSSSTNFQNFCFALFSIVTGSFCMIWTVLWKVTVYLSWFILYSMLLFTIFKWILFLLHFSHWCIHLCYIIYQDTGDQCSQLVVATLVPSTPIYSFFNIVKLQCKQTGHRFLHRLCQQNPHHW